MLSVASLRAGQQRRDTPQSLEPGTSTIAGKIIDAETKQPVPGAEITVMALINGAAGRGGVFKSASDGSYALSDVSEGMYLLTVRAPNYLIACSANPDLPDRCGPMPLLRDQKRIDINIALSRGATARGRVVDHNGLPVSGAVIRVASPLQPRNEIARTVLFSNASTQSAADGRFEVRAIPAGEWNLELELTPQPGAPRAPAFFYPGVTDPDQATHLEFFNGGIADNLLFVVPAITENTLTVRVASGALPAAGVRASLVRLEPLLTRTITLNDDGVGEIKGLMEGRYFVAARGWIKEEAWAAFEIAEFMAPSLELSLQMLPAGRITGRIMAQNGGLPPLEGVAINAAWVDDDREINPLAPDESHVAADGSFQIEGLFGKRSLRVIGLPRDWSVASVLHGRSDVSRGVDVPFDSTVDVTIIVARR